MSKKLNLLPRYQFTLKFHFKVLWISDMSSFHRESFDTLCYVLMKIFVKKWNLTLIIMQSFVCLIILIAQKPTLWKFSPKLITPYTSGMNISAESLFLWLKYKNCKILWGNKLPGLKHLERHSDSVKIIFNLATFFPGEIILFLYVFIKWQKSR